MENLVAAGTHKYPMLILWFKLIWASLAQSVERKALNLVVAGSSPAGGAFCIDTWIFLDFFYLWENMVCRPSCNEPAIVRNRAQKFFLVVTIAMIFGDHASDH